MKKLLMVLSLMFMLTGCEPTSKNTVSPEKDKVQLGLRDCRECEGDGKIEISDASYHCPSCDGFGKVRGVEGGVVPIRKDFRRGYEDNRAGVPFEDCPYKLLKYRRTTWEEGWLAKEKEDVKN